MNRHERRRQKAGHVWVDLDGDIVNCSCGDWRRLSGLEKSSFFPLPIRRAEERLGPVRWEYPPPSLIWAPAAAFDWHPEGTPKPGEVWYGPRRGDPPQFATDLDLFLAPAEAFAPTIADNIARLSLRERLYDQRNNPNTYAAKWRGRMRAGSQIDLRKP